MQIQDASLPHCATFQLKHEDHTLGNALRYLMMKKYAPSAIQHTDRPSIIYEFTLSIPFTDWLFISRDVDFAGYAIPHPSKPYIHLHVQTKGTITVTIYAY